MARYDSLRKTERNNTLKEYVKTHPDLSMKEVGLVFGITQSRVWRILHGKQQVNKPEKG
jgi:DNA-directed RNA polymerase specialized sigma subunit